MLMMFSTYMYTKYVSYGHSVNHTKVLTMWPPAARQPPQLRNLRMIERD